MRQQQVKRLPASNRTQDYDEQGERATDDALGRARTACVRARELTDQAELMISLIDEEL